MREYSIVVGIHSDEAVRGAKEFERSTAQVITSSRTMTREVDRSKSSFESLKSSLTDVRGLLAGFGVGFSMVAIIRQIGDFDASIAKIRSLMGPGALPGDLEAVTAKARELGATTVFSGSEAAQAMVELTKAGFDVKQSMAAAGAALDLAAADGLSMAEAAEITAKQIFAFKLQAGDATRVVNVLANASNASLTDVRGVGEAMKYVGSLAGALGISLEDTTAAVAALNNAGIDASTAGTSLRSVLSDLVTQAKPTAGAMLELGLNLEEVKQTLTTDGGIGKVVAMFAEAQRKLGNDTKFASLMMQAFAERGGPAMLALVSQLPGMEKIAQSMKDVTVKAKDMAAVVNDSLYGSFKELASAAEELVLQLGDAGLKDVVRAIADSLGEFGRGLVGMRDPMSEATGLVKVMGDVGSWLRENFDLLKDSVVVLASLMVARMIPALLQSIAQFGYYSLSVALAAKNTIASSAAQMAGAGASRVMAIAMATATTAASGLKVVMSFLGGPLGVILLAATALFTFSGNAEAASREADELSGSLNTLKGRFLEATEAQRQFIIVQSVGIANEAAKNIGILEDKIKGLEQVRKEMSEFYGGDDAQFAEGDERREAIDNMREMTTEIMGLRAEIDGQKQAYADTNKVLVEMELMQVGVTQGFSDMAMAASTANEAVESTGTVTAPTAEALAAAAKAAETFSDRVAKMTENLLPLLAAEQEFAEETKFIEGLLKMSEAQLKQYGLTHEMVAMAQRQLNDEMEQTRQELDPLYDDMKKYRDIIQKTERQLDPMKESQDEFNASLALLDKLLAANRISADDYAAGLELITKGLDSTQTAIQKQIDKVDENKEQADPWAEAWKGAVERIDGLFVDLWKSAFGGFSDFVDQVKETFKQMLAEMAHAAITRPILMKFAGMFGMPGGGAGGTLGSFMQVPDGAGGSIGAGNVGGNGGLGSLASSGLGGINVGALSSAAPYIAGAAGLAGGAYGFMNSGSSNGSGGSIAGMLGYGALGFAGATVGLGAVLGGAAGAATGVAGAGLGGALSGASGAAAGIPVIGWIAAAAALIDMISGGKLFGTRYRPESSQFGIQLNDDGGVATASRQDVRNRSLFRGRQRRTVQMDPGDEAREAADQFYQAIMKTMTEAAKALAVDVPPMIDAAINTIIKYDKKGKEKSREVFAEVNGTKYKVEDEEEAARRITAESILAVIKESFPGAEQIAAQWRDSTAELERGVNALMTVMTAIKFDPFAEATKQFDDAQKSSTERYREMYEAYKVTLAEFDGSIESLEELARATSEVKNAQFQLVMAFREVGRAASEMFGTTAQNIRESLMSPEELYDLRQTQIQELVGQLQTETDPARIGALAEQINRLTNEAYGMLDETQRAEMAGGFLTFLDEVDRILQERVALGLSLLEDDSNDVTETANAALVAAAEEMTAAAATFTGAAGAFGGHVDRFGSLFLGSVVNTVQNANRAGPTAAPRKSEVGP